MPIDDKDLELALLKSEKKERDVSDLRYAPMHVKVIVYTFLTLMVLGVMYGISDTFKKRTERYLNPDPIIDLPAINQTNGS